jgi:hypothetical protein
MAAQSRAKRAGRRRDYGKLRQEKRQTGEIWLTKG